MKNFNRKWKISELPYYKFEPLSGLANGTGRGVLFGSLLRPVDNQFRH